MSALLDEEEGKRAAFHSATHNYLISSIQRRYAEDGSGRVPVGSSRPTY